MFKSFYEIVNENGFKFEEHKVTTKDGYILTVFRIPGLQVNDDKTGKKPILLQHGILDSADAWIAHYVDTAPAFVLAKSGYDVWLGNSRGNKYSKDHINKRITKKDYWDFSFETMGTYDLPAVIDYILGVTGQPKLAYIGHS